jgi:hypothetical protein
VYEVAVQIGEGGMGQVYRARDTRLNRDVALKVLPHEFTTDPDRLTRFKREAQVLASLNHPNIAAIYGLEEGSATAGARPTQALVLELVEGPTLADRIAKGALPFDEALSIARQIAEALEAAHEQGIVHRDLKPVNIKVRADGRVKVLDFGLAKLTAPPEASSSPSGSSGGVARSPTYLPTITTPAVTAVGVILGTAAYMSPEQAKGRVADKRADVWAFGCVVYEMLAGCRPFEADDVPGAIAAILERQPAWDRLPPATPSIVRRLLRRCLEKDPNRRLHDIADARLEIDDAIAALSTDAPAATGRVLQRTRAAIVVAALASAALAWYLKPAGSSSANVGGGPARFLIAPSEPMSETEGVLIISRDGRRVAYAAGPLETTGAPVTLLEGIRQTRSGQPLISYSDVGSIVYVSTTVNAGSNALVWVDRTGVERRGNTEDLWLVDLDRGTSSRLTAESNTSFPVWTPDGRRLTLASAKEGSYDIYWRPVDGSAPDERLLSGKWPLYPFSWSPDGKVLAFVSVNPTTLQDIRVLSVDQKGASKPFLETQFREGGPAFSPDGKWIAYVSDESGRFEIYVRPFPGPGEKWPISLEGGNEPVWPRNGRELYYRASDTMMAVDVQTTPAFSASKPRKLFDKPYERSLALWANYDASPDGQRLLMVRQETASAPATHINVVLNWLDELKPRVPAK